MIDSSGREDHGNLVSTSACRLLGLLGSPGCPGAMPIQNCYDFKNSPSEPITIYIYNYITHGLSTVSKVQVTFGNVTNALHQFPTKTGWCSEEPQQQDEVVSTVDHDGHLKSRSNKPGIVMDSMWCSVQKCSKFARSKHLYIRLKTATTLSKFLPSFQLNKGYPPNINGQGIDKSEPSELLTSYRYLYT